MGIIDPHLPGTVSTALRELKGAPPLGRSYGVSGAVLQWQAGDSSGLGVDFYLDANRGTGNFIIKEGDRPVSTVSLTHVPPLVAGELLVMLDGRGLGGALATPRETLDLIDMLVDADAPIPKELSPMERLKEIHKAFLTGVRTGRSVPLVGEAGGHIINMDILGLTSFGYVSQGYQFAGQLDAYRPVVGAVKVTKDSGDFSIVPKGDELVLAGPKVRIGDIGTF